MAVNKSFQHIILVIKLYITKATELWSFSIICWKIINNLHNIQLLNFQKILSGGLGQSNYTRNHRKLLSPRDFAKRMLDSCPHHHFLTSPNKCKFMIANLADIFHSETHRQGVHYLGLSCIFLLQPNHEAQLFYPRQIKAINLLEKFPFPPDFTHIESMFDSQQKNISYRGLSQTP